MWCRLCSPSLALSLFLLQLASPPLVLPCGSTATTDHHNARQQQQQLLLKPKPLENYTIKSTTTTTMDSTSDIVPSELETLFNIMERMSSDRAWRASYPDPCTPGSSWPGIECKLGVDNLYHITRLDFGTPPNPTCKKTALFPSDIFNLPYLHSVFFIHCFTLTKTSIIFPLTKTLNSPLEQLSIRSNPALIGTIPVKLSSLKSLKVLTLSQNRLTGQIPLGIFHITSLVHLDLSYNKLEGQIPPMIGDLKNLVGLDLSYNSLSGFIPTSIGELGLLQKLDLSSNSLVGSIPKSIENLTSLAFIALSNNRLRVTYVEGLRKLKNLQYFIMEDNPSLMPLPSEFGMLTRLQELRLGSSGFSGTIPYSFCQLLNLSTLSLQDNRLTGQIPAGFSSLSHIFHLNLSGNSLQGVVPFNISFLNRLGKNLDLSGNPGLCLDPNIAHRGLGASVLNVCRGHSDSGHLSTPSGKISQASRRINLSSMFGMLVGCGLILRLALGFI